MSQDKIKETSVAFARRIDGTHEGKLIMEFLESFCYYNSSTWSGDDGQWKINEGKRQVVLRIKDMIRKGMSE